MATNAIPIGAKSIGKVYLQSKFDLIQWDSDSDFSVYIWMKKIFSTSTVEIDFLEICFLEIQVENNI